MTESRALATRDLKTLCDKLYSGNISRTLYERDLEIKIERFVLEDEHCANKADLLAGAVKNNDSGTTKIRIFQIVILIFFLAFLIYFFIFHQGQESETKSEGLKLSPLIDAFSIVMHDNQVSFLEADKFKRLWKTSSDLERKELKGYVDEYLISLDGDKKKKVESLIFSLINDIGTELSLLDVVLDTIKLIESNQSDIDSEIDELLSYWELLSIDDKEVISNYISSKLKDVNKNPDKDNSLISSVLEEISYELDLEVSNAEVNSLGSSDIIMHNENDADMIFTSPSFKEKTKKTKNQKKIIDENNKSKKVERDLVILGKVTLATVDSDMTNKYKESDPFGDYAFLLEDINLNEYLNPFLEALQHLDSGEKINVHVIKDIKVKYHESGRAIRGALISKGAEKKDINKLVKEAMFKEIGKVDKFEEYYFNVQLYNTKNRTSNDLDDKSSLVWISKLFQAIDKVKE